MGTSIQNLKYEKVKNELNHLVTEGTLEPAEVAEWAASIVTVLIL